MSVHTGKFDMNNCEKVKICCPSCGWTNDSQLVLVDRYLTDWPPISRGDGTAFLQVFLDDALDPDDAIMWCAECGEELQFDNVIEAIIE